MPAARKKTWDAALREVIKNAHGVGWSIRGHRDKVQVTRRFEDGSRSSVSLDPPWNASCQSDVIQTLGEIRQRMEAQGLGLKEAYALIYSAPTADSGRPAHRSPHTTAARRSEGAATPARSARTPASYRGKKNRLSQIR